MLSWGDDSRLYFMLPSRAWSLIAVWKQISARRTHCVRGKILACISSASFLFHQFQKPCDFAEMNTVWPHPNKSLQAFVQWKYRNNRKSVPQLGIKEACSFTGTVPYQMRRKKIISVSCRFLLQVFFCNSIRAYLASLHFDCVHLCFGFSFKCRLYFALLSLQKCFQGWCVTEFVASTSQGCTSVVVKGPPTNFTDNTKEKDYTNVL